MGTIYDKDDVNLKELFLVNDFPGIRVNIKRGFIEIFFRENL